MNWCGKLPGSSYDRAPFFPCDRVIARDRPASGYVVVTECTPDLVGGFRIEYERQHVAGLAATYGSAPSERFVLAPDDWEDAPLAPMTGEEWVAASTDGALDPVELAAAREDDRSYGRTAARARHYRRLAQWWLDHGALVAPGIADGETRGLRGLADGLDIEIARTVDRSAA